MHVRSRRGRGLAVLPLLLCACGDAPVPNATVPPSNAAAPAARRNASARPDIVLVSIDSLRADHLGAYGYARPTSPGLDRLAANGVRFEWAISTTSWTLPAHAALFTGLYDSAHGLVDDGLRLADAHVLLAEMLHDHGYHTAGFFGGPYLHPIFGFGQGFDVYESCMIPELASAASVRADISSETGHALRDVTGPRTLAAVTRWLESVDERPFFLFVHLWDVHYDYVPPPEYVLGFDPGYTGTIDGRDYMGDPAIHAGMPARDREHVIALYDAEIRFTDDVLARILDALQARGRLGSAIVVVTADHGEGLGEHGETTHGMLVHDATQRVPLI
ncbi:MAG: sulfatase, partial [Steroidobacteraceae bacterium]